jgi:hypothetical protein
VNRPLGRRAVAGCLICLPLALSACGAAGSSSSSPGRPSGPGGGGGGDSAPARDTFTGSISSGRGSFSGAGGHVTVYLHPHGSGKQRTVRIVFRGRCAASASTCTKLNGALSGQLSSPRRGPPDIGHAYTLTGTGRVSPLGQAELRGEVVGTGFITHGHELMRVTLTSPSGTVTVQATSGPVKGFTTP